jgi:hypothetical protein
MSRPNPTLTTSRRALLAGVPAAALGAASAVPALAAAAEPNPDAELIRLCAEYVALDREFCRLTDLDGDLLPHDPQSEAIGAQQSAFVPRMHELHAEIAEWTAETPQGLRALIQAARHTLSSDARQGAVDLLPDTEVAWAALDSALAMLDAGRA